MSVIEAIKEFLSTAAANIESLALDGKLTLIFAAALCAYATFSLFWGAPKFVQARLYGIPRTAFQVFAATLFLIAASYVVGLIAHIPPWVSPIVQIAILATGSFIVWIQVRNRPKQRLWAFIWRFLMPIVLGGGIAFTNILRQIAHWLERFF